MRKLLIILGVCLITTNVYAQPINHGRLEFTEEDLSPSVFPYQVRFSNASVTDNGDGTVSVSGGGSQTPWTSDIDGGGYNLTNVTIISVTGTGDTDIGGNLTITGSTYPEDIIFPNLDATPTTVAQFKYDAFYPSFKKGLLSYYDGLAQNWVVAMATPPTVAQDDYVVAYDKDTMAYYMRSITGGSESTTVSDTATVNLTLTGSDITADVISPLIINQVSPVTVTTRSISPTQVVFSDANNALTSDADLRFVTDKLYATYFEGDGSAITNIGQDSATSLTFSVKAGEALTKGQAVYISSATGNNPIVKKADNTNSTTCRVVGLITTNLANNNQGSVRRNGVLTPIDTRSSNTAINPLGQTWAAGDLLFSMTGGGLTNVRPTSGRSVKAAYALENAGVNSALLVYPMENPIWSTAASGETVVQRMGDDYGDTKVSFRNYSNSEKAMVDSYGNALFTNIYNKTATLALSNLTNYSNKTTADLLYMNATLAKDLVTTAPLTGGTDNIFPGADSDITIAMPQATTSADGYVVQADWDSWTDHVADNTQAHSDYMLNSGDVATGVYDFGGATSVEIPNAATPTTSTLGQIAIRSGTGMSSGLQWYDTASRSLTSLQTKSFVIYNLTATDDVAFYRTPYPITIRGIHAFCPLGNANVTLGEYDSNGANGAVVDSAWLNVGANNVDDDGTLSNAGIDQGDWIGLIVNNCSSNATLSMTWDFTYD